MDKKKPPNVLMQRDGTQAEVANNESVEIMRGLGWEVVGDDDDAKDGAEMTAKQLRAALDEKGIDYPARASKAELQALLDAS